jgi:fibronectin-binding autotransporter adhesin
MLRHKISLVLSLAALAAVAFSAAAGKLSADTSWTAGTSSWSTPGNWDNGVPGSTDTAYIGNGGTPTIDSGDAIANLLYVGSDSGGSGSLVINGGTLTIAGDSNGHNMYIGPVAGSTGIVTMSGGILDLDNNNQLKLGRDNHLNGQSSVAGGTAYFNQSGGTVEFTNIGGHGGIFIGVEATGTYTMSGGQMLNVAQFSVGYGGASNWAGPGSAVGTMYQSGGTVQVSSGVYGYLNVGEGWDNGSTGVYNISGSAVVSTPWFLLGTLDIAFAGTGGGNVNPVHPNGTVNQSGGSVAISTNLVIGQDAATGRSEGSLGGAGAQGSGTYNFTGGTLTDSGAGANLIVRYDAPASGAFNGRGVVDFHGTLTNNGRVVADGGTLDMSSFASVANTVANTANNGWFATGAGKLVLPSNNVATGATSTCSWGLYGSSNLVNSLQLTFNTVTAGGSVSIALLAGNNSELPALGNGTVVGAWKLTPPGGFAFGTADLTVRYDDSQVPLSGLTDSLQVLNYSAGQWVDATTGTADSVTKQITAHGLTTASTFAVFLRNQWLLSGSGTSDDANWTAGAMPNGVGLAANFFKAITAPSTVTGTGAVTLGAINFNNTNSYTLAGTGAVTLQTAAGAAEISVLAGSHTISAPVLLASPVSVNALGGNLELSGNIAGSGTLTKTGSGALLLSAASTFGGLTVNAGTLKLSAANTFGGLTAVNGGTLTLANSQALQYSLLQPGGTGTVTFDTLTAATLGGLQGSGQLSVVVNLSVGNNNASTTFSGLLSGGDALKPLNKIGSGTLTLSNTGNSQSYLILSSGTVSVSNDGNLGGANGTLVFNGGLLRIAGSGMTGFSSGRNVNWLNGGFDIVASNATFTVSTSLNDGGLIKAGSGTLVLAGISNSASTFTGGTTVEAGILQVGNASYIGSLGGGDSQGGDAEVRAGATLRFANFMDQTYSGQISGSGSVVKTGGGMLTLSGTDTYTGGTTVLGGILDIESVAALPGNSTLAIANTAEVIFATDLGSAIQLSLMLPGASGGAPEFTCFRVTTSAPAQVPEPGTPVLLAAAVLAALAAWRRKQSAN